MMTGIVFFHGYLSMYVQVHIYFYFSPMIVARTLYIGTDFLPNILFIVVFTTDNFYNRTTTTPKFMDFCYR